MSSSYLHSITAGLFTLTGMAHAAELIPKDLKEVAVAEFRAADVVMDKRLPADDLLVEIIKQDDTHSFLMGSVTRMLSGAHGTPTTRFFFAHREGATWSLGMAGDERFLDELALMPDTLVGDEERRVWTANYDGTQAQAAGMFLGIGLPWAAGDSWEMSAGIHGDTPDRRPYNSADFWSRSGDVRAASGGIYYRTCNLSGSALVHVVHDNGYDTTYYHMENLADLGDGTKIAAGTYLGKVGNALPCGGMSSGAHVHLSLEKFGRPVALDNKILGGWTFHEGKLPYEGYATRGDTTVWPGNRSVMRNYGEADQGL
jgi:LasA protease